MFLVLPSMFMRDFGVVVLVVVAAACVVIPSKPQTKAHDISTPCNLTDRHNSCPGDSCCVRDDFMFTETYCRQYGREGSNCVTHTSHLESQFECPCLPGLFCEPNIHGVHPSLFGKCTDGSRSTTTTYVPDISTTPDQPSTTLDVHGNPVVG